VAVVDAEPADIFNASARRAAEKFEFSPRIRNGVPVDVPNVQYVFRYKLQEDPAQEETP
jgi:protein TonB